jgi:hypothetical protein
MFRDLIILLAAEAERVIQIILSLPCLQQAFGLELFEVRQIAKSGEAERLQEFSCRHIGERRARLRRADGAVDEAMTLEGGDDVAADFAAREPGNLPPRHRLQIGDRGQDEGFGPGEIRNVVPCPTGMDGADRRREPGVRKA